MNIQEIEAAIIKLPIKQQSELSNWIEEYQALMWDQQIESDLKLGHLDAILAEVDSEYEAELVVSL